MNCSTPGLPVHHHLPEFPQTHVLSPEKDKHCAMPLTGWILNCHIRRIKHWSGGRQAGVSGQGTKRQRRTSAAGLHAGTQRRQRVGLRLNVTKCFKKEENQGIETARLASFKMGEKEGKDVHHPPDYLVGGRTPPTDGGRAGVAQKRTGCRPRPVAQSYGRGVSSLLLGMGTR